MTCPPESPISEPVTQVNTICRECTSEHLLKDCQGREILCKDCGLVIDDQLPNRGSEWKSTILSARIDLVVPLAEGTAYVYTPQFHFSKEPISMQMIEMRCE